MKINTKYKAVITNTSRMEEMLSEGQISDHSELQDILNVFPTGISHAFGYGSGVFTQIDTQAHTTDDDIELPMIDLIFATDNPKMWHEENLRRNPDHYAFLPRLFGSEFVHSIQKFGAGAYFNPMVQVGTKRERLIKYGVIDEDTLKKDLMEWNCMYIAGRLQKPTYSLLNSDEVSMLQQEYNLKYAVSTALLLSSGRQKMRENCCQIELSDIFEIIAGLSYIGDPRMAAGAEDPNKVKKLVHSRGQLDRFLSLYDNQFRRLEAMGLLTLKDNSIETNLMEKSTRKLIFNFLPSNLQQDTKSLFEQKSSESGCDSFDKIKMASKALTDSLKKIVGPPAKIQSAKGLITAGAYKSISYVGAKLAKGVLKGVR